jgi:hypothetical protein
MSIWRDLISTQIQARKLISATSPTSKNSLQSFNRTQSRDVTGLVTRHNTLRRHLYIVGRINNPSCRRYGEEEETSARVLCECGALASIRHTYLGSFFLAQKMLEFEVWVQSGTLVKEECSQDLDIRLYGTKGQSRSPTCIGADRTRNHLLFYSVLLHLFYSILIYSL